MPLTNPSELRIFLNSLGVRPKKGLSQNFIIDSNIVRKIVQEANVCSEDTVLEIGSGPGALTEALQATGAKVIAVEHDSVFAHALERFEGIEVHACDILDFDLSKLPAHTKVVSNLPYHLTAPILTRLIPHHARFSTITVMVQQEVARRIVASPKSKEYSSFTVFLSVYSTARYAFKVSHNCFYPKPKVDSAVVTFELHPPPPIDTEAFFILVRTVFQQRRKMIKTTLKNPEVGTILRELGENPKARPEELSLKSFISLFNRLGSVRK